MLGLSDMLAFLIELDQQSRFLLTLKLFLQRFVFVVSVASIDSVRELQRQSRPLSLCHRYN